MAKEGTLTKVTKILRQQAFLSNADDGRVSITWFILRLGLSLWQRMEA
jgi:DNA-binding IclR family transcriptional regulator